MQIPLSPSTQPKRPPLELCTIRLYSTGLKGKVYTDRFYKSMNHNFGIEMVIRNNTSKLQVVKAGGCVYDSSGKPVIKWGGNKNVNAHSSCSYDFYVKEETFSNMKEGKYKVQFWLNDKKVQREFFTLAYK